MSTSSQRKVKGKKNVMADRPFTMRDPDRYFDATFSAEERQEIMERITAECSLPGRDGARFAEISQAFDLLRDAETEIMNALHLYPVPDDWAYIHVCRQLEIDYKSFAKYVPKAPIEPFYLFVAPLFPHFKPAVNAMQLSIQTRHVHLAFVDWIDQACPDHGCMKTSHGSTCWDRFEKADYETAAQRVWAHNERRKKFTPLHLVKSDF